MRLKGNFSLRPSPLIHGVDIILEVIRLLQDPLDLRQMQSLVLLVSLRDGDGGEKHVSDLPSVEQTERQLIVPLFTLWPFFECFIVVCILFIELIDEIGIEGFLLLVVQVFERDGEVDTGLYCDIERSDSIRCEDEYAVVVLKCAQ